MEEQDFIHRQYSGYVSKNFISMTKLGYILDNMVQQYSWLKKCVKQFDITIVGDEYNLFHTIRHKDISWCRTCVFASSFFKEPPFIDGSFTMLYSIS